jgi:hypothetical protein
MNAFELRNQLLLQSKEYLEAKYHADFMHHKENGGDAPKYPTLQDIIKTATEMNDFISTKD